MTGYYDYVLGLIPTALVGVTAFLVALGIPLTAAVAVGAGLALVPMGHALFVRNPAETTSGDARSAETVRSGPSAGGARGSGRGGASPGQAD